MNLDDMLKMMELAEQAQLAEMHSKIAAGGRHIMTMVSPEESKERFWTIMGDGVGMIELARSAS